MKATVRYSLLGTVRAQRGDADLELGPRKLALLALLLRAPGTLPLHEAVDLLWDTEPPASAVNVVHWHIGELRRTLEPELTAARRIAWSSALAEWGIEEVSPGLGAVDEESISAFARREFSACCHPMGTCAMGEEEMSVVDSELLVRGLDGLRVADASVIPSVPCGSPTATVYAVAERAADLLHP
jgi:choline dehydrogenase-like flavoprotein